MAQAAIRKLPIQMAVLLVTVLEEGRPDLLEALMVAADPPPAVRAAVSEVVAARAATSPGEAADLEALLGQFHELWPLG